jgi:hypothetical protein
MKEATEWHMNITVVHDTTGYWVFNIQYRLTKKKKCAPSMVAIFTGFDSLRMKAGGVCCYTKKVKRHN